MKSMSQVLHLAQCPETLEEARIIITDQQEQLSRVRELLTLERAKTVTPKLRWMSKVSGLWYDSKEAAGSVGAVSIDGEVFHKWSQ